MRKNLPLIVALFAAALIELTPSVQTTYVRMPDRIFPP